MCFLLCEMADDLNKFEPFLDAHLCVIAHVMYLYVRCRKNSVYLKQIEVFLWSRTFFIHLHVNIVTGMNV